MPVALTDLLKQLDKEAKAEVDAAVEESTGSPVPTSENLWNDIYQKGTEPPLMRGREREEVRIVSPLSLAFTDGGPLDSLLLDNWIWAIVIPTLIRRYTACPSCRRYIPLHRYCHLSSRMLMFLCSVACWAQW